MEFSFTAALNAVVIKKQTQKNPRLSVFGLLRSGGGGGVIMKVCNKT